MTTPVAPRVRLYPPGGHQLTLNLVQAGQEAAVVLGGMTVGGGVMPNGVAAQWRDAAWAAFRTLISNEVTCAGATLRFVNVASGQVVEVGAPPSPTGGVASGQTVASACTLIKWGTDTGGRSGKGRTYLPGLAPAHLGTGGRTYAAAHVTAVATAISTYLASTVFTPEFRPAVLSFRKGLAYPITSGAISPIVGLQRRRMR